MLIKSTLALKCLSYFHSSSVLILYRHSHQVYQNVCVHERSTARLECEMSSKDVHIHWLKDGCDITASGRYIFMREGKRAEVIIEECQLADEGEYSVVCTQDNDAHEYVKSAKVTVAGKNSAL